MKNSYTQVAQIANYQETKMVSEILLKYFESQCHLSTMLFNRLVLHKEKDKLVCTIRFLSASHIPNKKLVLKVISLDGGLLLLVVYKLRSEISVIGTV